MPRPLLLVALLTPLVLLAGCLFSGGEPAEALAARKEAEGKAVGGACRHAGRAIEDCFTLNKRVEKAAMFAGWREMNDYMRDNKIEAVPPLGGMVAEAADKPDKPEGADKIKKPEEAAADDAPAKKPAKTKKHES